MVGPAVAPLEVAVAETAPEPLEPLVDSQGTKVVTVSETVVHWNAPVVVLV